MRVRDIMKDADTVDCNTTLKDAASVMADNAIGCLLIIEDEEPKGILTERDVVKQISDNIDALHHPVKDYMSKDIVTVDSEIDIDEAAMIMKQHHIKKLPVTVDGKIEGVITQTDLVAHASDFNDFSVF